MWQCSIILCIWGPSLLLILLVVLVMLTNMSCLGEEWHGLISPCTHVVLLVLAIYPPRDPPNNYSSTSKSPLHIHFYSHNPLWWYQMMKVAKNSFLWHRTQISVFRSRSPLKMNAVAGHTHLIDGATWLTVTMDGANADYLHNQLILSPTSILGYIVANFYIYGL